MWRAYRKKKRKLESQKHKKEEWYLAQIAYEIFKSNTQIDFNARNNAKIKDFLLEFKIEAETEVDKEKRKRMEMLNTKLFFCCLTGVGMEALSND